MLSRMTCSVMDGSRYQLIVLHNISSGHAGIQAGRAGIQVDRALVALQRSVSIDLWGWTSAPPKRTSIERLRSMILRRESFTFEPFRMCSHRLQLQ